MDDMNIRQLCNISWVTQTEWLEEKAFKAFQSDLVADPSRPVSHGARELMAMMGGPSPVARRENP